MITLGKTERPFCWLIENAETIQLPITLGTSTRICARPSGYDVVDSQANDNWKNRSQYGHKRLLIGVNKGPDFSGPMT